MKVKFCPQSGLQSFPAISGQNFSIFCPKTALEVISSGFFSKNFFPPITNEFHEVGSAGPLSRHLAHYTNTLTHHQNASLTVYLTGQTNQHIRSFTVHPSTRQKECKAKAARCLCVPRIEAKKRKKTFFKFQLAHRHKRSEKKFFFFIFFEFFFLLPNKIRLNKRPDAHRAKGKIEENSEKIAKSEENRSADA